MALAPDVVGPPLLAPALADSVFAFIGSVALRLLCAGEAEALKPNVVGLLPLAPYPCSPAPSAPICMEVENNAW